MKSNLRYPIWSLLLILNLNCKNTNNKEPNTPQEHEVVIEKDANQIKNNKKLSARALGLAYLEENKLEEAAVQFQILIELAPDEPIGYTNLGIVYLRMGKYKDAESILLKAKELAPDDPDIRLNLSKVYEMTSDKEKSIEELKESIEISPDHVESLYSLVQTYSGSSDKNSMKEWERYLNKIVKAAPTNIVSKLYLTELLLKKGDQDGAIKQLEEIAQIFPDFPVEAKEYYDLTLEQLHSNKPKEAITSFLIFHNYLKLTTGYQTGIKELRGSSGGNVGHPVISFSKSTVSVMNTDGSILESIRFIDATASAYLETTAVNSNYSNLALGDIDSDGDTDVFYSSNGSHYLFQDEFGSYENIINTSNIVINGNVRHSSFADFDNDGHLDLLILKEKGVQLFKNVSKGKFQDLTPSAIASHTEISATTSLFLDMDHDGDLDLFLGGKSDLVYRNNGNGTFKDVTPEMGFGLNISVSRDADFGDFDDDGDIDFLVTREDGNNILYSNLRRGKFSDVTAEAGITPMSGSGASAVGDYNNDGYLDIFITSLDGSGSKLFKNKNNGTFKEDKAASKAFSALNLTKIQDVTFLDFDNDGHQDILVVGENQEPDKRGIFLMHNNGRGYFTNKSNLLSKNVVAGKEVALGDYNSDGDLDFYLVDLNGKLRLLRNDGGNNNHYLQMKLVGLKAGSAKNNHFGVGAKIEVRAGDLYQMQVVTSPNIHFGMGDRTKADVVRILWTNGVPQNIFSPGSDEDLIEAQELKGSCPFLYTWNGTEFVFVKDMMWRSALGMPLGIMGGKETLAFANASQEYLKIPGELLQEKDGKYTIQITEELWETIYCDEIKLIAVDHPKGSEIYVDEKFIGPPYPELKVYNIKNPQLPLTAMDGNGTNLLEPISKKDHRYISNFKREKFQGITEMKELILDLGDIRDTENLNLFMNGWIFPTDASINTALSQSENLTIQQPSLSVINAEGEWEEVIPNIGFPSGKNKTVIIDLSDKFLSAERKVKIRTNMEIYWDYIFSAYDGHTEEVTITKNNPEQADYHYRGVSKQYRKGGRYGPHWVDYYDITKGQKWRDLTGTYTRYGDVTELLKDADDMYIIANAGDETTISFDVSKFPKLKDGWKRDFLIYSVGWVKDGDLNTSTGQTVTPLPFHGMSMYPYGENEHYPTTKQHLEYQKKYNTRKVGNSAFRSLLSKSDL
ncbi:VCBS repeat-containing protein [Maribacter sp. ANRC-HE7]|uniref:VCBS repeat-containing protein n=1 Tax=Maribacter aquimaris TaxID=2737171 RepID=A0ABR7UXN9_9FLAO|nr:CRTAC1 family protein [Maribacter aquimaris]MBD0776977.1 VCBS repeat-containing protein [Maribacter aquimaris]